MSLEQALAENTASNLEVVKSNNLLAELMKRLAAGTPAVAADKAADVKPASGAASTAVSTASSQKESALSEKAAGTEESGDKVDLAAVRDDAKKLIVALAKNNRDAAQALMDKYQVKNVSACPDDKIVALRDDIKAKVDGAESLA